MHFNDTERERTPKRWGVFVALALLFAVVPAHPLCAGQAPANPLKREVTLITPYPESYYGAETERMELEYAVFELAKQALLGFNFYESRENIGALASKEVQPDFRGVPLRQALDALLAPHGVRFRLNNDEIVLEKVYDGDSSPLDQIVTLAPPYNDDPSSTATDDGEEIVKRDAARQRITVQVAVMALADQAGLSYDWGASQKTTRPTCQRWVRPKIEALSLRRALDALLVPLDLGYQVRDNRLTLIVPPGKRIQDPLEAPVTLLAPYPLYYNGARVTSLPLAAAFLEVIGQAGLECDQPHLRAMLQEAALRHVRPEYREAPLKNALEDLLAPLELNYEVRDGRITILKPKPKGDDAILDRRVTLTPPYPLRLHRNPDGEVSLNSAVQLLAIAGRRAAGPLRILHPVGQPALSMVRARNQRPALRQSAGGVAETPWPAFQTGRRHDCADAAERNRTFATA